MKSPRVLAFPVIAIVFLLLVCPVHAKDEWVQVRSKNFFLIGNASEKDIRKVGTRLEQFRETFRQVFAKTNLTSPIPTNVVVFKSGSSYKPFKPKRSDGKIETNIAGYFQPGEDVNYITLSTEGEGSGDDNLRVIFHEYVHFIVEMNFGKSDVPPWFNEGLAEYYETFEIVDDQKVKLGLLQNRHLGTLREHDLMPLGELFNISSHQLHETGDHSRNIFYAQSWALMHYLLQSGKTEGLGKFLNALSRGITPEKAFQDAFQSNYTQMESELRKYIGKARYNYNVLTFENKLIFDNAMTAAPLDEAATNAYMGDLLYHINRADDAEPYLQNALRLQPDSSLANTALGMVKMRQRKFDDARTYLEKAIAGDSKNHIALYRYAFLLSREARDEFGYVRGFDKETTVRMRDALKKAIAINPAFTESYEMLGFINLVNNEAFDESITLLRTALKYQPGNQKYALRIAELLSRQDKLAEAAEIAEKIMRTSDESDITTRARNLLDYIKQKREFDERRAAAAKQSGGPPPALRRIEQSKPLSEEEIVKRQSEANLRSLNESLREPADGEVRVIGHVQKINCKTRPIGFVIKTPAETFTLVSKDFQVLALNAFEATANGAQVGCDEDISAFRAVITYRPAAKGPLKGSLIAIEFVPADFRFMTKDEMTAGNYVVYEEGRPEKVKGTDPPMPAPVDQEAQRRKAMTEAMRGALNVAGAGEKRELGYLERIECTSKSMYFHIRTENQQLKLVNLLAQKIPIRMFTPDLYGLQFGCSIKPIEYPAVFIYTLKPDAKAGTAGEIVSMDFVPKSFVLDDK